MFARGRVGRKFVAFITARTTYMHEADSAIGFSELNDPSFVTGPKQFQKAASNINFGFNWAYVNAKHIAYFESGWYPQRTPDSSPDFPIWGTGKYDWKNWNPTYYTEADIPPSAHPQAIDPSYAGVVEQQAGAEMGGGRRQLRLRRHLPRAADRRPHQGGPRGGRKTNIAQLVQAMELAATEDVRIVKLWPLLRQVIGSPRRGSRAPSMS